MLKYRIILMFTVMCHNICICIYAFAISYFSRFHLTFIITNIHMQCGPRVSPYYKLGQPLPKYGTSLCKFSSYINAFFIRQPRISSYPPIPRSRSYSTLGMAHGSSEMGNYIYHHIILLLMKKESEYK